MSAARSIRQTEHFPVCLQRKRNALNHFDLRICTSIVDAGKPFWKQKWRLNPSPATTPKVFIGVVKLLRGTGNQGEVIHQAGAARLPCGQQVVFTRVV